ncbi:ABC transporter permease [Anditalea andensis]|uniref:ABC transporter permease n=1 Tax=Anditalea andensis TaxID=1048983 RepID=UPI001969AD40|nr:FtsX-like permease family protein [Anditalea andensis]
MSTAFSIFAGLAIFIACLGLFALASFMTEQRKKEIGIRKVLGASVRGVVGMLSKEFSRLVLLSFLLAIPIGWWGISQWLNSYNYKVDIGWEMFIIAGLSAFGIAWITVASHSVKVAISNPVNSLKSE